jgi:DNA repair photolyase
VPGALRIYNGDPAILGWTLACLRNFGFDAVIEPPRPNGCRTVLVRGGLAERLRFFHTVDPVISRKRDFAGKALKTTSHLRVVGIEPIERPMELFDITTGTGDFIADGVVSHNCFARPTHTYLGFDAGRDFEKEIVVKVNVPEVLRAELGRPSWKREHVVLGTNTDPYQWVESRYKLMPGIWEALRDAANPCSVLTKSPLVLRDLPLLKEIAARTSVTANLSVATLDPKAWRASEPHTPHPRARLEAVAELNRAGVPTGVLVAPLMPGINDDPRQVEAILDAATEAGATGVGGVALHLRGEVRGVFMEWLRSYRPDLVPRYEELYRRGAYAPAAERERMADLLARGGHAPAAPFRRGPAALGDTEVPPAAVPREEAFQQPALF